MSALTVETARQALSQVLDPALGKDVLKHRIVTGVEVQGQDVLVTVEIPTHAYPKDKRRELTARIEKALVDKGAARVTVMPRVVTAYQPPPSEKALLPGVKNIIAVAAGKGGVGKSTVAVNLAVALARDGASVGLLDADITGPNVPLMLGLEGQPGKTADNRISPLTRHGVKAISIQFFVPQGQPIIWRGPLVGGAITQFLRDVDWGELDYLVIDLPPGTSDAQLTLAQAVPISGAVLVTTPQEVSLLDVEKALAMFKRMSVPVIGIVENMTALACPHCGEMIELFGRGGGERFSREHGLEYLGGVPLDVTVRQGGDVGVPAVAQREPGPAALALTSIARTIAARMSVRAAAGSGQPVLTIS